MPEGGKKLNVPVIVLGSVLVLVLVVGGYFLWARDLIVQKVVENTVTTQLDAVKAGNVSTLVDATQGQTTFFDDHDIDETEFLQSYLDGFDYQMGDVVVKGGFIDIGCTVHIKDFRTVAMSTANQLLSTSTISQAIQSDRVNLNAGVGSALMAATASCDQYADRTVHIRLVEKDGNWQLDNASEVMTELMVGDDGGEWVSGFIDTMTQTLTEISEQVNTMFDSLNGLTTMFTSARS